MRFGDIGLAFHLRHHIDIGKNNPGWVPCQFAMDLRAIMIFLGNSGEYKSLGEVCVPRCEATKFRRSDLWKMGKKCCKGGRKWIFSLTLTAAHIYICTRKNGKTPGFSTNPTNTTFENPSKTNGLLQAPSPCFKLSLGGPKWTESLLLCWHDMNSENQIDHQKCFL